MTDIALSKLLGRSVLREFFADVLSGVHVVVREVEADMTSDFDVHVSVSTNPSEFPLGLSLIAVIGPDGDFEVWLLGLAKALSEYFDVRSICDGSRYGNSSAPYWSVIWERGAPFLADDSGTLFGDGEGGPVRIVRSLSREEMVLPTARELVKWVRSGVDPTAQAPG